MADQATTVLIVDDQMPFRMAARSVVGVTPGFEVVGEAKSGEEAVEQVEALHPELILMDINMDGISGIEATRRITAEHPEVKVILLSTYDEEDLPADARTLRRPRLRPQGAVRSRRPRRHVVGADGCYNSSADSGALDR